MTVRNFVSQQNLSDYNEELKKHYGNIEVVSVKPDTDTAKQKTLYLVKQVAGNGYDAFIYDGEAIVQITDAATADINHKIDKVDGATQGNFATFKADGSIEDSAKKAADFEEAGAAEAVKTELTKTINGKADKGTTLDAYGITDAYTKNDTDAKIAEILGQANKITVQVVDDVEAVTTENIIYLIKDEGAVGEDKYEEYMYIGGEAVKIGDTSTDLTDYCKTTEVDSKISTALGGLTVTDTAEENKYVSQVTQANGKITVTRVALPDYSTVYDAKGAAEAAQSAAQSYTDSAIEDLDTVYEKAGALNAAKSYADGLATNYATKAQGAKADTALQPTDFVEMQKAEILALFN